MNRWARTTSCVALLLCASCQPPARQVTPLPPHPRPVDTAATTPAPPTATFSPATKPPLLVWSAEPDAIACSQFAVNDAPGQTFMTLPECEGWLRTRCHSSMNCFDGCNWCHCNALGHMICTLRACQLEIGAWVVFRAQSSQLRDATADWEAIVQGLQRLLRPSERRIEIVGQASIARSA